MPERIMGADGSTTAEIRAIAGGSNALYVYDTSAGGTANILGSVEVSSIVKPITIVGSPNYNLPVIGSVQTSNLQNPHPITGSVQISSVVANVGITQQTSPWITEGSVIQKGTWYNSILGSPNYNLPVIGSQYVTQGTSPWINIGSVQVSSIVGALPAGTALLGSVVASPVGTTTILGSVQVSSIVGALPVGTLMLGSTVSKGQPFNTSTIGSVWVTNSSTNILQPRTGRQSFRVVPTGSSSSLFVNGKIWFVPGATASVLQGAECIIDQPWGIKFWEGSVAGITDAGSIVVSYYEVY